MRKIVIPIIPLLTLFALPKPVFAHAFGQLYTLPLPVWLYLWGGAAAVLISFVLIGFFVSQNSQSFSYRVINLSKLPFLPLITSATTKYFLKVLSVLIFVVLILAGFLGKSVAADNFATVYVWIIFWLGFTYISAIFGNLWNIVNPFKILVEAVKSLTGVEAKGLFVYPKILGYLPALVFYYIFIWLELLSNGWGTRPNYLASIILFYTFLNFLGVFAFGKKIWFKYFEFFSVFFRLIAKLSPVEVKNNQLFLRLPFVGLLKDEAESFSLVAFILFMLSSTAFDGFRSTTTFRKLDIFVSQVATGNFTYQIIESVLLAASILFFLTLYLYAVGFIKILVKTKYTAGQLAQKFAFSLIPIAAAYNVAHYYTLLLVSGQSIIPALSDPFNLGWNLFGSASYVVNVGIVGASFVWNTQVAAIIAGHIAAVYLAHLIALKLFKNHKTATVSQIPMLILMIIYTMCGLWILSQPLALGR